eukprot:scaffold394288_cov44-Prasinocladus_malaysianus.AAC.1
MSEMGEVAAVAPHALNLKAVAGKAMSQSGSRALPVASRAATTPPQQVSPSSGYDILPPDTGPLASHTKCTYLKLLFEQDEARVSHGEADHAEQAEGSCHRGAAVVHPATSVHATVMADGTQSEGEDDMTSQQGNTTTKKASMVGCVNVVLSLWVFRPACMFVSH